MIRAFILPILLAGLIALPASIHADDDSFGMSKEDRARHDERADSIRKEYANKREIKRKLQYIKEMEKYTIANFAVKNQPVSEVLKDLQEQVQRLDPDGRGINIAYACSKDRLDTPITLSMRDVPLPDLLRYIGMQCKIGFEYEEFAIVAKNIEDADVIDVNKLAAQLAE